MKILVIGSTGRVGLLLTEKLLQDNHKVVGTSRHGDRLFEASNYSQIDLNLLGSMEEIRKEIPNDIEAVYFVSGSRGKNLLQVDLDGAVKTMRVAEDLGIKRYIMLSTIFSLQPERWNEVPSLRDYYLAKFYADQWLMKNTELSYTILQPGHLKEVKATGKISVNVNDLGDNSIEDVAETLKELLDKESTFQKVISMHDGGIPIKEAVSFS
ncbi:NAD-dependent epimerase/dehydratase family protein [Fulvivirga sp. M361]|uniref:NAD(P)H-binding protein n=1 Tax=Fulvivirga sp. M361 TaxID=2594266 RepID=UPI00117BD2DD|nr:NAD(P)H-binding protein [Fulvivirga sp. M361]TRX54320.1 NAD-dependent epimerase/dehydratase family protein [Fulvivirga sp. M361]